MSFVDHILHVARNVPPLVLNPADCSGSMNIHKFTERDFLALSPVSKLKTVTPLSITFTECIEMPHRLLRALARKMPNERTVSEKWTFDSVFQFKTPIADTGRLCYHALSGGSVRWKDLKGSTRRCKRVKFQHDSANSDLR